MQSKPIKIFCLFLSITLMLGCGQAADEGEDTVECSLNSDCPQDQMCDELRGQCVAICREDRDCEAGFVCDDGVCIEPGDPESICGSNTDWFDVESNQSSGVFNADFITTHNSPTGNIHWNTGGRFCTGTMITANLFLTAGHCLDPTGQFTSENQVCQNIHVDFNYQNIGNSSQVHNFNGHDGDSYQCMQVDEYRIGGLDYAIIDLNGNPGNIYGTMSISDAVATTDNVIVFQHPGGIPKVVDSGTVSGIAGDFINYNNLDTDNGSSGAGIINGAGRLVGVHTSGGCDSPNGSNHGVNISAISAVSGIIQGLLGQTQATCNGVQRDENEDCDGNDLGGTSCSSLGYSGGFLACKSDCSFETSECCNNECSPLNSIQCLDANTQQTCSENYDTDVCLEWGGDQNCSNGCSDSQCLAGSSCGDEIRDAGEDCDESDLGTASCQNSGFSGGVISCNSNCTLNTAFCCSDECTTEGETQCSGSTKQTCSRTNDTDECLEWGQNLSCSPGLCSDGSCCWIERIYPSSDTQYTDVCAVADQAIWMMTATDPVGNSSTFTATKCVEGSPGVIGGGPSANVHYWVATGEEYPTSMPLNMCIRQVGEACSNQQCCRREGTWLSSESTKSVTVNLWPDDSYLNPSRNGEMKRLFWQSGGGDDSEGYWWHQGHAAIFQIVCD